LFLIVLFTDLFVSLFIYVSLNWWNDWLWLIQVVLFYLRAQIDLL